MTLLSSYPPHPHAPHACTPPRRTHTHTHAQGQALAHSQGTRARARAGTHTCAHSHTHAHQRPHCTPARTRTHEDGASSAAAPGARRVHGPLARQGIRHHLSLKHLRWVFLCRTFVGCGVSLQHLCRVFCLRGRFLLPCFFSAFWFCFPNEVNKAAGRYFIAFLLAGLQSTLTRE